VGVRENEEERCWLWWAGAWCSPLAAWLCVMCFGTNNPLKRLSTSPKKIFESESQVSPSGSSFPSTITSAHGTARALPRRRRLRWQPC
jgi:hypothetical protein